MRARPRTALVAKLLLFSVTTGLLLFLFEMGLRRFRPLASSQYSYRIPDPALAVEHNLSRTAGVRRIVLLGDFFMEGYSVDLDHSLARLLEKELNRSIPTEVINLGVGGYGTLQEYLAFIQEGRAYEPEVVLLGFLPANDTVDNPYALQQELWEGSRERELLLERPSARLGAGDGFEMIAPDIQRAVAVAEERRRRERSAPWWERTEVYELGRRAHRADHPPPACDRGGDRSAALRLHGSLSGGCRRAIPSHGPGAARPGGRHLCGSLPTNGQSRRPAAAAAYRASRSPTGVPASSPGPVPHSLSNEKRSSLERGRVRSRGGNRLAVVDRKPATAPAPSGPGRAGASVGADREGAGMSGA